MKTALEGIAQMHHFKFLKTFTGKVKVKNTHNDNEHTINLLKSSSRYPEPGELPDEIVPQGLSHQKNGSGTYIYDKIREFVPSEVQDLICPKPTVLIP